MKRRYIISCLITLLCCTNAVKSKKLFFENPYDKKIETIYQGFFSPTFGRNTNQLIFTIRNKTSDTLYLSSDNFKIVVLKEDRLLREDSTVKGHSIIQNFISDFNFLSDDITKLTPDERALRAKKDEVLKKAFAEKLYKKYVKDQKMELSVRDKNIFKNTVYSYCIVLLPYETISESFVFISESLNHDCRANATYMSGNIFTTFLDKDDKKIYIKY